MTTNLNNNTLYITANVLDSASVAYHKLCNPYLPSFNLGCAHGQAVIIPPESRALDLMGVFRLGGSFF